MGNTDFYIIWYLFIPRFCLFSIIFLKFSKVWHCFRYRRNHREPLPKRSLSTGSYYHWQVGTLHWENQAIEKVFIDRVKRGLRCTSIVWHSIVDRFAYTCSCLAVLELQPNALTDSHEFSLIPKPCDVCIQFFTFLFLTPKNI